MNTLFGLYSVIKLMMFLAAMILIGTEEVNIQKIICIVIAVLIVLLIVVYKRMLKLDSSESK